MVFNPAWHGACTATTILCTEVYGPMFSFPLQILSTNKKVQLVTKQKLLDTQNSVKGNVLERRKTSFPPRKWRTQIGVWSNINM